MVLPKIQTNFVSSCFFRKKQSDSKTAKVQTAVSHQQFDNDIDIVNTQPLSSNYRRFTYGATRSEDKLPNSVCEYPETSVNIDNNSSDNYETRGELNTNDNVVLIHNEVTPGRISW